MIKLVAIIDLVLLGCDIVNHNIKPMQSKIDNSSNYTTRITISNPCKATSIIPVTIEL